MKRPSINSSACTVCYSFCSKSLCDCVCTCEGTEYLDCLKRSKEMFDEKNNLDEENTKFDKKSTYRVNIDCTNCYIHLECKRCVEYRCSCLNQNKIESNSSNGFLKENQSPRTYEKERPYQDVINNQIVTVTDDPTSVKVIEDLSTNNLDESAVQVQELRSNHQQPVSIQDDQQLLATYLTGSDSKTTNLSEFLGVVDRDFKKLLRNLNGKNLYKLHKNLEYSVREVRDYEKTTNSFDQKRIDQQNYDLDQHLNMSFREKSYQSFRNQDEDSDDSSENQEEENEYLNKFDLFAYLSLSHCDLLTRKLEQSYAESKIGETIRNLCLFINTKRIPEDYLINSKLKLCLQNTIDTIQLNEGGEVCSKLFCDKLQSLSLFRFLNFLVLDLNDSSIQTATLQFDNLITLRHLEIYGNNFNFQKGKWSNSSVVNLIVHDKLITGNSILEFFPNLIVLKIKNSSGDILVRKKCSNFLKLFNNNSKQEKSLRAISISNLTFNDFIYILHCCKNVELIDCTSLDATKVINLFRFLPNLKFLFLSLNAKQFAIADSIAYLIYYHLIKTNNDNPLNYSNQLYCPKDVECPNENQPCFKPDCINCAVIEEEKLFNESQSNELQVSVSEDRNQRTEPDSQILNTTFNELKKELDNIKNPNRLRTESSASQPDIQNHRNPENLKQLTVYLDGLKLTHSNLSSKFNKVYEMRLSEKSLKINEINRLAVLFGIDWMKEKLSQLDSIEIDARLSIDRDLAPFISRSSVLIVSMLDYATLDYLINRIVYLRTIKFNKINRAMSAGLEKFWAKHSFKHLKQLKNFEIHNDKVEKCSFDFLRHCESLHKLKLINVFVDCDEIVRLLTANTYCTDIELCYPLTKIDQRKLIEILSFNALVHKNLNYNLTIHRNHLSNSDLIDLVPNLKINP